MVSFYSLFSAIWNEQLNKYELQIGIFRVWDRPEIPGWFYDFDSPAPKNVSGDILTEILYGNNV